MAKWNEPYRLNVCGILMDVGFNIEFQKFDGDKPHNSFQLTLAFARKVGTVETAASMTILNPHECNNTIAGQRIAFKRLMNAVHTKWHEDLFHPENLNMFMTEARKQAHEAGMWKE